MEGRDSMNQKTHKPINGWDIAFKIFLTIFMVIFLVVTLYPVINTIALSLTTVPMPSEAVSISGPEFYP